ncbi:hypothetical protein D3C78_1400250 [compost metagenome]
MFEALEQHRIKVGVVGQLRLVELLECPGLDLFAQEVVGRHDHVITGTPGQQLAFQGFIGIKHVIHRLDARGFFEVRQGVFADVVRPVINMHGGCGLHTDGECQAGANQHGFAKQRNRQVVVLLNSWAQVAQRYMTAVAAWQQNRRATYPR